MDSDDLWRRTGPVDGAGVRVGEERVVHGVNEDPHVSGSHSVWIRLEFWLNVVDKPRANRREQTVLWPLDSAFSTRNER